MNLSHDCPRMTAEAKERLTADLGRGCCCGGASATLRRRLIRASVTVHAQCDNCGRSLSTGKRSDHWYFQSYPEWDDGIRARYDYATNEATQQRNAERAASVADAWDQKRAEYAQFCRDDPDWHALRDAVLARAGRTCEACLSQPAVTAHHLTYDFGPLPPAWMLRAVCRACHNRLHASKHGATDEWEPRFYELAIRRGQ